MILTDAGPLVAIIDRGESSHRACVASLSELTGPMLTTWPAFTEAMYLLGEAGGWVARSALWGLVEQGDLEVALSDAGQLTRMRSLMHKYRDQPMDLADASLVALAEDRGFAYMYARSGRLSNLPASPAVRLSNLAPIGGVVESAIPAQMVLVHVDVHFGTLRSGGAGSAKPARTSRGTRIGPGTSPPTYWRSQCHPVARRRGLQRRFPSGTAISTGGRVPPPGGRSESSTLRSHGTGVHPIPRSITKMSGDGIADSCGSEFEEIGSPPACDARHNDVIESCGTLEALGGDGWPSPRCQCTLHFSVTDV